MVTPHIFSTDGNGAIDAVRNQVRGQSRLFLSIANNLNLANYHSSTLSQHCTAISILMFIARSSLIAAFNPNNNSIKCYFLWDVQPRNNGWILSSEILLLWLVSPGQKASNNLSQ
jgi:hypothetical protein